MISSEEFRQILNKFEELKPVIVLGDVGVDKYTSGSVRRISPEAPVPVLEVNKEWKKLGLAANVADNLKSLNVESTICGVIGDDGNGSTLEHLLEESGLKTWGIVRSSNRMTTFKERVVTNVQQICRIDYETPKQIDSETYNRLNDRLSEFHDSHSAMIIEDYGKGLLNEEVCQNQIKKFRSQGKIVAVDPSRITPPKWYQGANLLKPNWDESQIMAGLLGYGEVNDKNEIAKILINELEIDNLIITLGAQGMALATKEDLKVKIIPTVANEVFDVSGAGDTAMSALTASLVAGADLESAAWIGNCASGVVVAKKGTALVNREELTEFHNDLIEANIFI